MANVLTRTTRAARLTVIALLLCAPLAYGWNEREARAATPTFLTTVPFGLTQNSNELSTVISVCGDYVPATVSVTSPRGVVIEDAASQCSGGTGLGFFVYWDYAHGSELLVGANAVSVYACNSFSQCVDTTGYYHYEPPSVENIEVRTPADQVVVQLGDTVIVKFAVAAISGALPVVFNDLTTRCYGGLALCTRLNDSIVATPRAAADTLRIRVRGDSVGSKPVSAMICIAGPSCLTSTQTVAVVPRKPVAHAITLVASKDTIVKASAASFSVSFTVTNQASESATIDFQAWCDTAVTLSSCNAPSAVTLAAGTNTTVSVNGLVAVTTTPSKHGVVQLTARVGGASASAHTAVSVGAAPATSISVSTTGLNPLGSIARDQCLMVAAGDAAGVECGDLRLTHALPSMQTNGRIRAPTLLYLSRHARPVQLVAANVTRRGSSADSVTMRLTIAGVSPVVRTYAWPTTCRNAPCRVVVPVDAESLGLASGWYPYTLYAKITGTSDSSTAVTGGIAIVNRVKSPFGRGWWLEGVERVLKVASPDSLRLWIGGDGSTRLYKKRNDTVFTVEHPVNRLKDTLFRTLGTNPVLRRRLPNGAYVQFDMNGLHTHTVNAQGHVTRITYGTGVDSTIPLSVYVPTNGDSILARYDFRVVGADSVRRVDTILVKSPRAGETPTRATRIVRTGNWNVTSIVDADNSTVGFTIGSSGSGTSLVTERTNRRGHKTKYGYNASMGVDSALVEMTATSDTNIVTRFCAAESRSLIQCAWGPTTAVGGVPVENVVTRVDGPRGGLVDVMTFHINRFGGPDSIQNPLGGRTRLERDSTLPALVTRVIDPLGLQQRAWYDTSGRGLVDSLETPGPTSGTSVKTRIIWHATWNLPSRIRPPAGAATHFWYASTVARLDSQRVGPHDSTAVRFTYDAKNRLTLVRQPGGTESFVYDTLFGNIVRARSFGYTTVTTPDRWGIDSVTADSVGRLSTTSFRNVLGRVDSTRAVSTQLIWSSVYTSRTDTARSVTRVVRNFYDAEGNVDSLNRRALDHTGTIGMNVTTKWTYDAARRVRSRVDAGLGADSFWYDPAGLVTRQRTGRGHYITSRYDALGRLQARMTPPVSYNRESCAGMCLLFVVGGTDSVWSGFPLYPQTRVGGFTTEKLIIPGDVEAFTYDAAGRVLTANNRDARITRSYHPNGALAEDQLRIRNYDPTDTLAVGYNTHHLTLSFTVDVLGRRTLMTSNAGFGQRYIYHDSLGVLTRTDDLPSGPTQDSTVIQFGWTAAGQMRSRRVAALTPDEFFYDSLGRLAKVHTGNAFVDSMSYDDRGKQMVRRTTSGLGSEYVDTARMQYDGFGALVGREQYRQYGGWNIYTDRYIIDALGNLLQHEANEGWKEYRRRGTYTYTNERALRQHNNPLSSERDFDGSPVVTSLDTTLTLWDDAGNAIRMTRTMKSVYWNGSTDSWSSTLVGAQRSQQYYDALNRMRHAERWVGQDTGRHTIQQYRYDALGRRVLVRTLKDSISNCGGSSPTTLPLCLQTIERFYWDGDQLLWERRAPGAWNLATTSLETASTGGAFFGDVRYTHGPGLDEPLLVQKAGDSSVVPHRSGRGGYEAGRTLANHEMNAYHWPSRADGIYPGRDGRYTPPYALSWFGSLPENKSDGTGLVFMRNRYFDPASGRFTQRDPIGLAGGMSLYGYGAGDPINHSDPFGLCPRVTVNGSNVHIEANVTFLNGSPGDHTRIRSSIRRAWERRIGSFNVTLDLEVGDAPEISVTVDPKTGHGLSYSRGRNAGGQMKVGFAGTVQQSRINIGHEFGHVAMGGNADDHSEHPGNLMAGSDPGFALSDREVRRVIANCGSGDDTPRETWQQAMPTIWRWQAAGIPVTVRR